MLGFRDVEQRKSGGFPTRLAVQIFHVSVTPVHTAAARQSIK